MRIVLVTAEPVFALGVKSMLESTNDLILAAVAGDRRAGIEATQQHSPDVVLMDLALPGGAAIPATRDILSASAAARVLLIAAVPTARDLLTAMAAGARGLVTKHDGAGDLCTAIRDVAAGRRRFPPDLESFAAPRPGAKNGPLDVLAALSPRERQVVNLIVEGMSSRDVGRELCISLKTVETHRAHINKKLGCRSPAELVRFAARNGLLAEPSATAESGATAQFAAA